MKDIKGYRSVKVETKKSWAETHKSVAFACNLFNRVAKSQEGACLLRFCKEYGLMAGDKSVQPGMNTRAFFKNADGIFCKAVAVQKKFWEVVESYSGDADSANDMVEYAKGVDGRLYRLVPVKKFSIENLIELAYTGVLLNGAEAFTAPLSLSKAETVKPEEALTVENVA